MTVETDYHNAKILVKRGDELVYTFEFKDFVPAIKVKEIGDIQAKIREAYKENDQSKVNELEEQYFDKLMSSSCNNPISHKEAMEKFSLPEINSISEEAYIFLMNWSSIDSVKQYAYTQQKLVTKEKEENKSESSQK